MRVEGHRVGASVTAAERPPPAARPVSITSTHASACPARGTSTSIFPDGAEAVSVALGLPKIGSPTPHPRTHLTSVLISFATSGASSPRDPRPRFLRPAPARHRDGLGGLCRESHTDLWPHDTCPCRCLQVLPVPGYDTWSRAHALPPSGRLLGAGLRSPRTQMRLAKKFPKSQLVALISRPREHIRGFYLPLPC